MTKEMANISPAENGAYRPIWLFGVVLLVFTIIGIVFFTYVIGVLSADIDFKKSRAMFIWFVGIISTYYIIVAIGILRKTVWGYYLFKSLLYLMFPTLPMGIVSYKYLKYMKTQV